MATRRSMSDAKTVLSPSKRLFALISEPGIREYRSVDLLDIAHEMADVEFALAASQARGEALEQAIVFQRRRLMEHEFGDSIDTMVARNALDALAALATPDDRS